MEVRALNQSNDLIDVPSEVREGNRFRFVCNVSNSEDYPQAMWQFRWSNSADDTWHHEGQGVEIIVRIHWKFLSEFHATKMSLLQSKNVFTLQFYRQHRGTYTCTVTSSDAELTGSTSFPIEVLCKNTTDESGYFLPSYSHTSLFLLQTLREMLIIL